MPIHTYNSLRQQLKKEGEVIAVIWSRQDFPAVWDRMLAAYKANYGVWEDQLVNATGDALSTLCREHLGIDLSGENRGYLKGHSVKLLFVNEADAQAWLDKRKKDK